MPTNWRFANGAVTTTLPAFERRGRIVTRVIRGLRATLNGPVTKPLAAIRSEVTVSVTRPPSKGTVQHLHSFIVRFLEMQSPKALQSLSRFAVPSLPRPYSVIRAAKGAVTESFQQAPARLNPPVGHRQRRGGRRSTPRKAMDNARTGPTKGRKAAASVACRAASRRSLAVNPCRASLRCATPIVPAITCAEPNHVARTSR